METYNLYRKKVTIYYLNRNHFVTRKNILSPNSVISDNGNITLSFNMKDNYNYKDIKTFSNFYLSNYVTFEQLKFIKDLFVP